MKFSYIIYLLYFILISINATGQNNKSKQLFISDNSYVNNFIKELYLFGEDIDLLKINPTINLQIINGKIDKKTGQKAFAVYINRTTWNDRYCGKTHFIVPPSIIEMKSYDYKINGYAIVDFNIIKDKEIFITCNLSDIYENINNWSQIKSIINKKKNSIIYVSSSEGNDQNSGEKPSEPLRTINTALTKGYNLKLKCGDTFYENIILENTNVTTYGEGKKPIICGFKIPTLAKWEPGYLINDSIWIKNANSHIWRIQLNLDGNYYNGYNTGIKPSQKNNIGCIYNIQTNNMNMSYKCRYYKDLKSNFDFWQHSPLYQYKESDFNYLYLYYDGDPNKLPLAFTVYSNGIHMNNSSVENITIKGWGRHGIACGSNVKIKNCEIDCIGGSIQLGSYEWISLGNGIEFYISTQNKINSEIENCHIGRCYDCGLTIQGQDDNNGNASAINITFKNNIIENCCQAWEDFLRTGPTGVFYNCTFTNNICINNGMDTGFRYPKNRFKYCQILGNNFARNTYMKIENNLFINGNYYCSGKNNEGYKSHIWNNNLCYIKRGFYLLSNYNGSADVLRIPHNKGEYSTLEMATKETITKYRTLTGDKNTQFVIIESDRELNLIVELIKKIYKESL